VSAVLSLSHHCRSPISLSKDNCRGSSQCDPKVGPSYRKKGNPAILVLLELRNILLAILRISLPINANIMMIERCIFSKFLVQMLSKIIHYFSVMRIKDKFDLVLDQVVHKLNNALDLGLPSQAVNLCNLLVLLVKVLLLLLLHPLILHVLQPLCPLLDHVLYLLSIFNQAFPTHYPLDLLDNVFLALHCNPLPNLRR
jgi:hypothetical protein